METTDDSPTNQQNKKDGRGFKQKFWKGFWTFFKWLGLTLTVAIIGWFVREWLTSKKDGDLSPKYIAVVMSGTDRTFTIPLEFKQGFGDETKITTSKGQNISIEKKDDQYSIEQAKIIADKLVKDENCVMIIGNSNSQLTEITLNSILDYNGIKPAYILPIATADGIISQSTSEKYNSILRMVPDNQNQAKIVKRFIYNKIGSNAKVAILVDEDNQTYSKNLSKNIGSEIIAEDGNIVLNQSYGNSQRLIGSYEILERKHLVPDVIVYVGISSNGLLLIEELKALKIKTPVVFTDGCTVKELIKKAGDFLGSDAYFLSAVSKSEKSIEPTYEPIGKDAFALANKIIKFIDGPVTRESVSKFVSESKDKITLDAAFAGAYKFDPEGNNKEMNFKIYNYKDGALTEVIGIK